MIREARKAGLPFDEEALAEKGYIHQNEADTLQTFSLGPNSREIPQVRIESEPMPQTNGASKHESPINEKIQSFADKLHVAGTKGQLHDALAFNTGTAASGVISWRIMEYLPFRRMDLRPDGTWAPIRFPLPMGEVRDIPRDAWIHNSALRRMEADGEYRPGNLIVGGGGRGMKRAPDFLGMGKWKPLREEGDPVGEIIVRDDDGDESNKET